MSFNHSAGALPCPCFKCRDRTADCHGFCLKYKAFEGENLKHREAVRKQALKDEWARSERKSRY